MNALSQFPLFGHLEPAALARLTRSLRPSTLERGQVLWRRGEETRFVAAVVRGRLMASRRMRRREAILDVIGPGEVVGLMGLLLDRRRAFDACCLRRSELALLPADTVSRLLDESPGFSRACAADVASLALRLTARLETLNAGTVEQRLARVLLNLLERFGEPFPGGTLVPLRLRREQLASLAATTVETTSRRLSAWKQRGILVSQPLGYLVRNLAALKQLSE